jgi:16S rRNA (uracil1498-N3)-methyltransferase
MTVAPPRLFVDAPLAQAAQTFELPAGAARHVQVLRLQPGDVLTLFDGRGGEWAAEVAAIGRSRVEVTLGAHAAVERELRCAVTLAVGMPANDRMDNLIEKATELGVAAIQPLVCARSVLKLNGDRAAKKVVHWQGVAIAAAEQSARTRVPRVAPVCHYAAWQPDDTATRWLLDPRATTRFVPAASGADVLVLSGPEGGFTGEEEARARSLGFASVSLGARTLRADTAPLAALAALALACS